MKRLLRLRPLIYNWITTEAGNGQTVRFWSDNWSPFGRISEFLQLPPRSRLGIPETATLHDLYSDGSWNLPPARSEEQLLLHIHLTSMSLTTTQDHHSWNLNGSSQVFSTGMVYRELKHHNPIVPWNKIVWSPRGIPRHNFNAWLLIQNCCPTRDRLLGWGLQTDPLGLLCNAAPESRDHIYFQCHYSWNIWTEIAGRVGQVPDRDWNQQVSSMQQTSGHRHLQIIRLLTWQCTLYYVWAERNSRLHHKVFKPSHSISSQIQATIRSKVAALRDQSPRLSSSLFAVWNA